MYIRRKCYSSLYEYDYNDYLYEKYFSDFENDYDYYDQRCFGYLNNLTNQIKKKVLKKKTIEPTFVEVLDKFREKRGLGKSKPMSIEGIDKLQGFL